MNLTDEQLEQALEYWRNDKERGALCPPAKIDEQIRNQNPFSQLNATVKKIGM